MRKKGSLNIQLNIKRTCIGLLYIVSYYFYWRSWIYLYKIPFKSANLWNLNTINSSYLMHSGYIHQLYVESDTYFNISKVTNPLLCPFHSFNSWQYHDLVWVLFTLALVPSI